MTTSKSESIGKSAEGDSESKQEAAKHDDGKFALLEPFVTTVQLCEIILQLCLYTFNFLNPNLFPSFISFLLLFLLISS